MKDLSGVRVAVIGLGASGVAAARLALAEGGEVYVSDSSETPATAARGADLRSAGASVDVGGHDVERVAGAGLVVVSPGIPPDAPVLRELAERGVAWISEPELAARFHAGSLIAVTGTNGKTTVTLLVDHLLRAGGVRAAAGGNVGGGLAPPASDLARVEPPYDWWVLEMSSFQLSAIATFRPDIGVVTNLSPDHLDRYASVEAYYADKARIFDNADDESVWVLPVGDEAVRQLAGDAPGRRVHFGLGAEGDARLENGTLMLDVAGEPEPLLDSSELPLLGRHNVANALAAATVARLVGVEAEVIAAGLRSAQPLPHRLDPVVERDGVLWVNDSKATNVAATRGALESLSRPVVLLLGGKDKGEDFGALAGAIDRATRVVVTYGAAGPRIATELRAAGTQARVVEVAGDLASVVEIAAELAERGDAVVLSPACSSFDMFDSYEHRGRAFRALLGEGR